MENLCVHNDVAVGHFAVTGAPVPGYIIASQSKFYIEGIPVCVDQDIVYFYSHPHSYCDGTPCNYQEHFIPVSGSAKITVNGLKCARNGDTVPTGHMGIPVMVSSQVRAGANPL